MKNQQNMLCYIVVKLILWHHIFCVFSLFLVVNGKRGLIAKAWKFCWLDVQKGLEDCTVVLALDN